MRTLSTLAAAILTVSAALATPPRVVHTTPPHGATDVDHTITELRVMFDQDMSTESFSWVGGGVTFPDISARPFWKDARTCVLPVELKPEHDYRLSINAAQFQNFRNTSGEPAVPHPLHFTTAPDPDQPPATDGQRAMNQRSLDELREWIDDFYSYNDRVVKDWDALFASHRERLVGAPSTYQFARRLARVLAEAQDLHIWIEHDGHTWPTHTRSVTPNFDINLVARSVPDYRKLGNNVGVARFPNGTLYVLIATFDRNAEQDIGRAVEFIASNSNAPGLIIDVRPNAGGDENLAQRVGALLTDEPAVYAQSWIKGPGGYMGPFNRTLEPADTFFAGPVGVLMGPACMSSTEGFLLMMDACPNVTLIGERSYGSSGNPKPRKLRNGVTVYLPSWIASDPNGNPFEGVGIEPDIVVEGGAGPEQDTVLVRAVEFLQQQRGD